MRGVFRRAAAAVLTLSLLCTMSGCTSGKKPEKKPEATGTAGTSQEPTSEEGAKKDAVKASGKGNRKSDVPFIIGCDVLERTFNPFSCQAEQDRRAVDFTQLRLLTFDREGAVVNKAIEGEDRTYNGEEYHYQGPTDLHIKYQKKKNRTRYTIHLREDILFGDGEPVTIDDVIFSMYAFADKSYEGTERFGELDILKIERVDDYRCRVMVKGYDRDYLRAMNIPICPLHFYGNEEEYSYEEGKYGFPKGDVSSLIKKKNAPMGAGPYKFIKYESGIVYYEANADYYLGCPLTAFIQLKEVEAQSVAKRVEMLAEEGFDMIELPGSNETITEITTTNSSGKLNGGTISTRLYDGARYSYIGMNADAVCVDGKPDSTRSKYMRTAIGTLLACNRYSAVSIGTQASKVINYPASDTSWSVPQTTDEEYTSVYAYDRKRQYIYNGQMNVQERSETACKAALGYLQLAGFKVKKGRVVSSPENTSRHFKLLVPKEAHDNEGMQCLLGNAKPMFERIGLKLSLIQDVSEKYMKKALKKGTAQLWGGFAPTDENGMLYEMFYSRRGGDKNTNRDNYFGIRDSDLDEYIEEAMKTVGMKKSIRLYNSCYAKIMEWAVVVPYYQERDISIFSSSRINMETITPDITTYYGWWNELQNIEMK